MDDMTLTASLASYLAQALKVARFQDVAAKARRCLLDILATIISGTKLRAGERAPAFVNGHRDAPTTLIPDRKLITDFVNAVLSSTMAVDTDDTGDTHLGRSLST